MSVRANIAVLLFGIVLEVTGARATSAAASAGSLDQALAIIQDHEFLDLTYGLKTVDQIDPKEFLLRLVVLDVHDKVAKNPDYVVTLGDVKRWEAQHGAIPAGAFVALRTDWSN